MSSRAKTKARKESKRVQRRMSAQIESRAEEIMDAIDQANREESIAPVKQVCREMVEAATGRIPPDAYIEKLALMLVGWDAVFLKVRTGEAPVFAADVVRRHVEAFEAANGIDLQ